MTWELFYLTCFSLGLLLCVLSLFTGGGHGVHIHAGHFHLGGHAVGGHAIASHAHLPAHPAAAPVHPAGPSTQAAASTQASAHPQGSGVSPINGFTLTAFLCWFGGVGYLLRTHTGWFASATLATSAASGLVGASLIFWFLAAVLLPHERALTAEDTAITGVVGHVTDPLQPGATGEILYSQLGARRSVPARSEDGAAIDRGTEVVVLRYERGIAYVRRWDDLDV